MTRARRVSHGARALLLALLFALPAVPARAQERAAVTVDDFAWMEGHWIGEGPEGTVAEIHYTRPEAGVLVGTFRLWRGDELWVIELLTLRVSDSGLEMRVRHFDAELTPFEEEHPLTLVLESAEDGVYRFRNVYEGENPTVSEIRARGPDRHESWSELAREDGSTEEILVEYRRLQPPPGS